MTKHVSIIKSDRSEKCGVSYGCFSEEHVTPFGYYNKYTLNVNAHIDIFITNTIRFFLHSCTLVLNCSI